MSWPARVWHIVANDLVRFRVWLAIYFAVVAITTWGAVHPPRDDGSTLSFSSFLVVGTGMLVTILLVQADSPTRPVPFWRLHPTAPSSMLAAKLALAIACLVGVGLVGEYAALRMYAPPTSEMAHLLIVSAGWYVAWLCAAVLVSAVTLTFALTIAIGIITAAGCFGLLMAFGFDGHVSPATRDVLCVCAVLGTLLFLRWLYAASDSSRAAQIVGTVATGTLLIGGMVAGAFVERSPGPQGFGRQLDTAFNEVRSNASLTLSVGDTARSNHPVKFTFQVTMTGRRPSGNLSLEIPYAVRYAHGVAPTRFSFGNSAALIFPADWVATLTVPSSHDSTFTTRVTMHGGSSAQRLPLRIDSFVASGQLVRPLRRVVGRLPLRSGAWLATEGVRFRIAGVRSMGDQITVDLRQEKVTGGDSGPSFEGVGLDAAVINLHRAPEALPLTERSTTGSDTPWSPLLLPGVSHSSWAVSYTFDTRMDASGAHVNATWMNDAQVEVSATVDVDSSPLHAVVVFP